MSLSPHLRRHAINTLPACQSSRIEGSKVEETSTSDVLQLQNMTANAH